jgi:uncharacterized membrane protein
MMVWGLILLGISVGRLLDNALGIGNVWGNVISVVVALVILAVAMYRKGKEIEEARRRPLEGYYPMNVGGDDDPDK